MYWGVACMDLMDRLSDMDREGIIQFLVDCQDLESGGFRPVQNHDPHLLNTLSAVQVAAIFDCLDKIDRDGVVKYVKSLQQEDGSFWGDKWGEVDNRFSFCALATLALLGRLDAVDTDAPVLKICFGPPTADFWSVWSSQKARKFRQIQPTTMISQ